MEQKIKLPDLKVGDIAKVVFEKQPSDLSHCEMVAVLGIKYRSVSITKLRVWASERLARYKKIASRKRSAGS